MKQKGKIILGTGLLAGTCCGFPGVASEKPVDYPNLVFVFPDQMRQTAMGFWNMPEYRGVLPTQGDPVVTPALDRFAGESLVFTSAISNCPLCSPYRGSLFTGQFPSKSGVPINCISTRPYSSLPQDKVTFSDVLASAGYETAYYGKWHLDHPTPNDPENPGNYVEEKRPAWDAYTPPEKRHGFKTWYSYGTFDVHKNPHYWDNNGRKHTPREYSPEHEADKAIEFLKNRENQRDNTKPFALFVSMNPPHHPYNSLNDCMEQDYNLYRGKTLSQLLVRKNADTTLQKAKSAPYYFAAVSGVDRAFGRILGALKELGLEKNTIVVFTSDHGETMCSHGVEDAKNQIYSEAFRVPMLVRWPLKIRHRTEDLMIGPADIMPTLLSMMGLKKGTPEQIHGTDYSGILLETKSKAKKPSSALYICNSDGDKDSSGNFINYFPVRRGIVTGRYTLEMTINKKFKLVQTKFFDHEKDPYQLNNLPVSKDDPVIRQLLSEMAYWLRRSEDPWYAGKVLKEWISY